MSKAEEKALEAYPIDPIVLRELRTDYGDLRHAFTEGYHQAEKNLELTWEDMMIIHKCCKDAMNLNLYAWETAEGQKKIYENVLKRFKELKK